MLCISLPKENMIRASSSSQFVLMAIWLMCAGFAYSVYAQDHIYIEKNEEAHVLRWNSEEGTTSFLQRSTDLIRWDYMLHYDVGDGSERVQEPDQEAGAEGQGLSFYRLQLYPTNLDDPDDTDGDGLHNLFELSHGYVPIMTDSDDDGVADGDEDLDEDGESNLTEITNGTDAGDSSSNSGDGVLKPDVVKKVRGKDYDVDSMMTLWTLDGLIYSSGSPFSAFHTTSMGEWVEEDEIDNTWYRGAHHTFGWDEWYQSDVWAIGHFDHILVNEGDLVNYPIRQSYIKVVSSASEWAPEPTISVVTMTIPAGERESNIVELRPLSVYQQTTVKLLPVEIAVDANRNGEIEIGTDQTSPDKPYRFWINSDTDDAEDAESSALTEDSSNNIINTQRDLEDFTRVWFNVKGLHYQLVSGDAKLGFRWTESSGEPCIKLYSAADRGGGRSYLTDEVAGAEQIGGFYGNALGAIYGDEVTFIDKKVFANMDIANGLVYFLLEGVSQGSGKLTSVIEINGEALDVASVDLKLLNVKEMYETWTIGEVGNSGIVDQWPASRATQTSGKKIPAPQTVEEKDYVLFVHGWNMHPGANEVIASTMYKRLWQQGYKGRFGTLCWPTLWTERLIPERENYDRSEMIAWNCGSRLKNLVSNRSSNGFEVRLYAHSMGNVVASEALRQGAPVHTYISAQAAIPAHIWDNTTTEMAADVGDALVWDWPTTPNVYGNYWQAGATFSSDIDKWKKEVRPSYMDPKYMPETTRYINHFNEADFALSLWQISQKQKPDSQYQYERWYLTDRYGFTHNISYLSEEKLELPADRYEIFAYAAEARSYATGAEGATVGVFEAIAPVNLLEPAYDFGDKRVGHSGQFEFRGQRVWAYWKQTMKNMLVPLPQAN